MQALQVVNSIRAEMGLSAEVASSPSISEAPTELAENEASVRQALSEFLHSLALLGYTPPSWKATPKQVIDDFHKQDSTGDLDTIYEQMIDRAPSVKQAEAKQLRARRELHLAELNLRYCRIVSAADGVVVRRIVNPGEQVELGQVLMEVRPLTASD